MSSQKEVKKPSKFAIVNSVVAALNLGDYGKIENFVNKTARTLEREVETAERSIVNEKHNIKSEIAELEEKLEDAQQSVEEAYTNLSPDDLKTNEAQRLFMETYLSAIDTAEAVVLGFEKEIKKIKTNSEETISDIQKQIDIRKKRIARLTQGVVS